MTNNASFDALVDAMDSVVFSPDVGFGVTVQWLDGDGQWQPINATVEQVTGQYGPKGRENETVTKALEVTEQDARRIAKGHSIQIDNVDHMVDCIEYSEGKLPRLHLVLPLPESNSDEVTSRSGHRWNSR